MCGVLVVHNSNFLALFHLLPCWTSFLTEYVSIILGLTLNKASPPATVHSPGSQEATRLSQSVTQRFIFRPISFPTVMHQKQQIHFNSIKSSIYTGL